jgi:hypothetical protein
LLVLKPIKTPLNVKCKKATRLTDNHQSQLLCNHRDGGRHLRLGFAFGITALLRMLYVASPDIEGVVARRASARIFLSHARLRAHGIRCVLRQKHGTLRKAGRRSSPGIAKPCLRAARCLKIQSTLAAGSRKEASNYRRNATGRVNSPVTGCAHNTQP